MKQIISSRSCLAISIATILSGYSGLSAAQQGDSADETETIEVKGIRSALTSALNQKRDTANITEIIKSEDIGKLPDNNLAEVLENVTGVQIDRTAGVGTGVQIRGTDANRVEINGVSTVSSGSNRTGISFDDLPAALIASLEVTKSPTAKTVEGSVGGTVNLRTLRGNSLSEQLIQVRVQAEQSDLADSTTPRLSATYGDNWETNIGKLGVVVTGSYAEQDVASINPRFDRDRVVMPDSGVSSARDVPFLRTQFLDQPFRAWDYETTNFTGSLELQYTENLKFYFDATLNDQERAQKSTRAFFSGTGSNAVVDNTTNTGFDTVDLGSIDSRYGVIHLGEVEVVTSGILGVGVDSEGRIDPNLRTESSTSSRLTESRVFAFGSEWRGERLKLTSEVSYSDSETTLPSLNTGLDFINPNGVPVGPDTSADNGTPAIFNLKGNTFEFGIAQGLSDTPTTQQLLDVNNYVLRSLGRSLNEREGSEAAFRVDASYDVSDMNPFFVDVNAGLRWNKTTNTSNNVSSTNSFGNWDRPNASLFAEVISPGPNNFNGADDRTLYISDYLVPNPDLAFDNPDYVINTINDAILQNNANSDANNATIAEPSAQVSAFFDIEEETTALYLQGDYEAEINDIFIRGNLGFRYLTTDLTSNGTSDINGEITPSQETTSYDFILPRFNLSAEITDDVLVRVGIGKDIRRPDFNDLSTSINFGASASASVDVGNPKLEPEQIWSYDLSLEYYFSPASIVSIGLFHKDRENLITTIQNEPAEPIGDTGQIERDVTPPCEGGGIFNPNVPPENYNVFSSRTDTFGICVAERMKINAAGSETQSGIELAFQYDLSEYESSLGWASGFGVIANYTYQEAGGGLTDFRIGSSAINQILGRTDTDNSTPTLEDDVVTQRIELDNLSENAYNFTLFYDKYDLNFRMRYTWRDAFIEEAERMRFNIPSVVGARGQLNMSVSYDVTDAVSVGVDAVNLTREDRTKWCFNEDTLLCEQDITDRRITAGITAKF